MKKSMIQIKHALKLSLVGLLTTLSLSAVHAEDLNLNARPETTTVMLNPVAFGLQVGGLAAVNEELRNESDMLLTLGGTVSIRYADAVEMGVWFDYFAPEGGLGGGIEASYLLGKGAFRPLIGAGLGLTYLGEYDNLDQGFGPSGKLQVGLLMDVTRSLQLRVLAPFHLIGNENMDKLAGLSFTILFTPPHYRTKVKTLNY